MERKTVFLAALLAGGGSFALLWCVSAMPIVLPGWPGALSLAVFISICVLLGARTRTLLPQRGWAENMDKVWTVFAAPALYLGLSLAALIAVRPLRNIETALMALLLAAGGWMCCFYTLILIRSKSQNAAAAKERLLREEMDSFMAVIRSQRHDYNFHIQTIAELIRRGDMEECRRFTEQLVRASAEMNAILPIKDAAISALIHSFRVQASQEGIPLHIDIQNDMENVCTNAYETNKIIANLLQNAIDEVKTHRSKGFGIWLQIVKRGEFCAVHVYNELRAAPAGDMFGQGFTTKAGHDGVGLASVKSLLQGYRGTIYSYLEDNVIHFIAKIPLRC